jgi:hypothetical protein
MAYCYNGDPVSSLNPFINMLNLMDDGEQQQPAGQQPAAQEANAFGRFRLPEFWPQVPGIWFARAELRFEIGGVISERLKFAYTVDTLP